MHGIILLLHILGATVWTGGHLVLACCVLPRALKARSVEDLRRFESAYERIGVPSLILQIVTGLWLAHRLVPDWALWMDPSLPVVRVIWLKLGLLVLTAILAADARLRIIPKLDERHVGALAWHIIPVTILSVLFVVVGVAFRTGWFY